MTKIHYFQRYSSVENTVTNNTLQLLARIYDYSTSQASRLLSELTGQSIEIGIEITQQERGGISIPDGKVIQRSFKVLLESKVDSPLDTDQLIRHASSFAEESQKILLLLTREPLERRQQEDIASKIQQAHPGVIFRSITYEDICHAVTGLFQEYERDIRSIVDDYVEYCNDADLYNQAPNLMRIVPCSDSISLNQKYGVYFQPSDRGYTKHSYVGIYANKSVSVIWAIDAVFDIEVHEGQLKKTLVQGRDTDEYDGKILAIIQDAKTVCGYNVESGHRFFCGQPQLTDFKKTSSGGIMGARFVNLRDQLGAIADVVTMAEQLKKDSTWE